MTQITLTPCTAEELPEGNNLLQSGFWGSVKKEAGQELLPFRIDSSADGSVPLLVYIKKYAPRLKLAYLPHGPVRLDGDVPETPPSEPAVYLETITEALRPHLPKECVFIRYDLPWRMSDDYVGFLGLQAPFTKAPVDIQPPSTVILDISGPENGILKQMKSKTRYNIRLAEKKGVVIEEEGIEGIENWYDMYKETAKRDQITIHTKEYYEAPFRLLKTFPGPKPELRLFTARIDGKPAAGIIVAACGSRATYLYGASNNYKRNYMPAYALQWEAIRWAKARGCISYDFFGIPPTNDPDHPMHGLFRFKTGFGGEIVHRFGCYDYPVKPALYKVSGAGEKLRNFYYKKVRKR